MTNQLGKKSKIVNAVAIGVPLVLLTLVLFWALDRSQALPEGPAEIVWDLQPCGFCAMHVGDPAFAAQLQTSEGETLAFDDAGCLFALLDRDAPKVHAIYFRHHREPRWIARGAVAFERTSPTPMGYGLGAVDAAVASEDALNFDQAHSVVRKRLEQYASTR